LLTQILDKVRAKYPANYTTPICGSHLYQERDVVEAVTEWLQEKLEEMGKPEYGPYSCERCDMGQQTLKGLLEDVKS
jgi:hypothetical protein